MFLMLCAADYALWVFSSNPFNPWSPLIGVVVLSALGTKALLIGMWFRKAWARYALGSLLVLSLAAFSVTMFFMIGGKMPRSAGLLRWPLAGMCLQVMAFVPLAHSRSIRRQMHPMTGRD